MILAMSSAGRQGERTYVCSNEIPGLHKQ